ncbi:MAG: hypothetical protein A2Y75_05240 [Candidatus Solincola sediminis]|uniref:Uncharacterized protein n=1 Tax=Candidatus Solincola sediminis TaxID=1797199 RepID=A0A1F2WG62_9ACTN|nr:MAG: hypothetical protein A2Y75_05240 [Candidatus Solincola sediminis]
MPKTRFAIVTTTINVPTTLMKWAQSLDERDVIIVAGDKTSPHSKIIALLSEIQGDFGVPTVYLSPEKQTHWLISSDIGWRSIQRRNIAVLEAMRYDSKFVTTIDDDNEPVDPLDYFSRVEVLLGNDDPTELTVCHMGGDAFINMCQMTYGSTVVHRGLPRVCHNELQYEVPMTSIEKSRLGVFQSLWFGHPDIDALDRIHNNIVVNPRGNEVHVPARTDWCPIDSQATTYRAELAPLLCVWPHVGRADDIWASYVARKVMDFLGWSVGYGAPYVKQDRGQYDDRAFYQHLNELEKELLMYRSTTTLCDHLRRIDFTHLGLKHFNPENQRVLLAHRTLVNTLYDLSDIIPPETLTMLSNWYADVRTALTTPAVG